MVRRISPVGKVGKVGRIAPTGRILQQIKPSTKKVVDKDVKKTSTIAERNAEAQSDLDFVFREINDSLKTAGSFIRGSAIFRIKQAAKARGFSDEQAQKFADVYVQAVKKSPRYEQAKAGTQQYQEIVKELGGVPAIRTTYIDNKPIQTYYLPGKTQVKPMGVLAETGVVGSPVKEKGFVQRTKERIKEKVVDPYSAWRYKAVPETVFVKQRQMFASGGERIIKVPIKKEEAIGLYEKQAGAKVKELSFGFISTPPAFIAPLATTSKFAFLGEVSAIKGVQKTDILGTVKTEVGGKSYFAKGISFAKKDIVAGRTFSWDVKRTLKLPGGLKTTRTETKLVFDIGKIKRLGKVRKVVGEIKGAKATKEFGGEAYFKGKELFVLKKTPKGTEVFGGVPKMRVYKKTGKITYVLKEPQITSRGFLFEKAPTEIGLRGVRQVQKFEPKQALDIITSLKAQPKVFKPTPYFKDYGKLGILSRGVSGISFRPSGSITGDFVRGAETFAPTKTAQAIKFKPPRVTQKPRTRTVTKVRVKEKEKTISKSIQQFFPKQKERLVQVPRQKLTPKITTRLFPRLLLTPKKTPPRRRPPKIPTPYRPRIRPPVKRPPIVPPFRFPGMALPPTKKRPQSYNVYAKAEKTKKWIILNKQPLTRLGALSLGAKATDQTLSAKFRISSTKGKPVKIDESYWGSTRKKFREGVIRKKKFKKTPNKFIEKRGKRIDTLGEKRGLSLYAWLKRRKRKRKKK